MELSEAIKAVHADYLLAFDGSAVEAVEHVRNTLILPTAKWVPGSFRLEDDGTTTYHAYCTVLRASDDMITAALAALSE